MIDATRGIRISVFSSDIASAIRGDAGHCVIANACKRMFGSDAVLIWPGVAYVDMMQDDGSRAVERFVVSTTARKALRAFDENGSARPGGLRLDAPSPSQRLGAQSSSRKARQKRLASLIGEAGRRGDVLRDDRTPAKARRPKLLSLEGIRNGAGMVQFIKRGAAHPKKKGNPKS